MIVYNIAMFVFQTIAANLVMPDTIGIQPH